MAKHVVTVIPRPGVGIEIDLSFMHSFQHVGHDYDKFKASPNSDLIRELGQRLLIPVTIADSNTTLFIGYHDWLFLVGKVAGAETTIQIDWGRSLIQAALESASPMFSQQMAAGQAGVEYFAQKGPWSGGYRIYWDPTHHPTRSSTPQTT